MTFGEGSDVDTVIVVRTMGTGQGEGAANYLFLECFSHPKTAHGKAIVLVPLPPLKRQKGCEDNEGVGSVGKMPE